MAEYITPETALLVLITGYLVFLYLSRDTGEDDVRPFPDNTVLIDGSNVMHWGGVASPEPLRDVVHALEAKGLFPIVYFDANVGWKLENRRLSRAYLARLVGVEEDRVVIVPSGTTADQHLLYVATTHDVQIVSNDLFRDWAEDYPEVRTHGLILKGRWVQGDVSWRFPQDFREI